MRSRITRWAGCAVIATLSLTGCGVLDTLRPSNEDTELGPGLEEIELDLDQDSDGYAPVVFYMTSPAGVDFDGASTTSFGSCGEQLVQKATVPIHFEDTAQSVEEAVNYLLDDAQFRHGTPELQNSVMFSADDLSVKSVEVSSSSVTVNFDGAPVTRSGCESERIEAQIAASVAATANVDDVTLKVDGKTMAQVLGVEPFDVSQIETN